MVIKPFDFETGVAKPVRIADRVPFPGAGSHPLFGRDLCGRSLNPRWGWRPYKVVQRIAETGVTIVLVGQDIDHSLSLIDRAYVMERGTAVLTGTGRELLENPHVRKAYLGI